MSKLVAALSVVAVLLLSGCFAPDSGSGDSAGSSSEGVAGSSEQPGGDGSGDDEADENGADENEADEDEADENEADEDEGEGDDGGNESEGEPAQSAGPCDAVVPFEDVSGLINDPAAGAMTNGGDVITQCEWVSADGNQSLLVSARDAALIGATGIDNAYRKTIKNVGEEAGSRIKTGNASVQVYAMVKGSGKAQPVLYTVTWKGEDVEVEPLVKIAKRIV